jgi:hypothetical protein
MELGAVVVIDGGAACGAKGMFHNPFGFRGPFIII